MFDGTDLHMAYGNAYSQDSMGGGNGNGNGGMYNGATPLQHNIQLPPPPQSSMTEQIVLPPPSHHLINVSLNELNALEMRDIFESTVFNPQSSLSLPSRVACASCFTLASLASFSSCLIPRMSGKKFVAIHTLIVCEEK